MQCIIIGYDIYSDFQCSTYGDFIVSLCLGQHVWWRHFILIFIYAYVWVSTWGEVMVSLFSCQHVRWRHFILIFSAAREMRSFSPYFKFTSWFDVIVSLIWRHFTLMFRVARAATWWQPSAAPPASTAKQLSRSRSVEQQTDSRYTHPRPFISHSLPSFHPFLSPFASYPALFPVFRIRIRIWSDPERIRNTIFD